MPPTLRAALVSLGVLEDIRPGQPRKYIGEEGQELKRQKMREGCRAYISKIREAAKRGEPRPELKRGRPRLYETEEEARAAANEQNRNCRIRHRERLLEGVEKLSKLVLNVPRSSDE